MLYKTLDKSKSIHVLNMFSIVLAWGVTCYFFDALVTNNTVAEICNLLIMPVKLADQILGLFSLHGISGNFLLMFLTLWISFAIPLTKCHRILTVANHDSLELREWYLSKCENQ